MKVLLITVGVLLDMTVSMKRVRPGLASDEIQLEAKKQCAVWNPVIHQGSTNTGPVELLLRVTQSTDLTDFFTRLANATYLELETLLMDLVISDMAAARFVFLVRPVAISEQLFYLLSTVPDHLFVPGDEKIFKLLGFEITEVIIYEVLVRGCSDWFLMFSLKRLNSHSLPIQVLHMAILQSRNTAIIQDIIKNTPLVTMTDVHFAMRNNVDYSITDTILNRVLR